MSGAGAGVLKEACQQLVDWQRHPAFAELTMTVNLSRRQLLGDEQARLKEGLVNSGNAKSRDLSATARSAQDRI